jgi:Outer membrane protein beta-barrel domain
MKTTIFTLLFLTFGFSQSVYAGEYKADVIASGTMLAGGFVTFSWSEESIDNLQNSEQTEKILGFSPTVGYFIFPNLALMGSLNYTRETAELRLETGDTIEEKDLKGAMMGLRYYLPTGNIYLYGGVMAGMYEEEVESELNADTINSTISMIKTKGYQVSLQAGLLYMVSRNIGLELGVQFHYTNGEVDGDTDLEQDQKLTDYSFALGYFGIQALF